MLARHRRPRPRLWPAMRVLIVLVATFGVGVLAYPSAAAWVSDRAHASQISGYLEWVATMPRDVVERELAKARQYNQMLPPGPLRDPWAPAAVGDQAGAGEGLEAYLAALDVSPDGVIGRVRVPAIDVDLPIFHGTSEKTLRRGIGHLFGSGLPVGGAGIHTVVTGHSGLASATMLTHLNKVTVGDQFTITVLDQVLTYQVDQILVVLPNDTDALERIPGEDHVTLVTCTPTAINTHRLLVRGVRIPTPATDDGGQIGLGTAAGPGFPWWAIAVIATPTGTIGLTHPRKRSRRGWSGRTSPAR